MRKIKFRAMNIKYPRLNKEWEYFYFPYCLGSYEALDLTEYEFWSQFTGLIDKNGVEIYEGDIVKHNGDSEEDSWDRIDVVEWVERASGFYPLTIEHKWRHDIRKIEVIGNIWENPELLEGKIWK